MLRVGVLWKDAMFRLFPPFALRLCLSRSFCTLAFVYWIVARLAKDTYILT